MIINKNKQYAGYILYKLLNFEILKFLKPKINIQRIERFCFDYIIKNGCVPLNGHKFNNKIFFYSVCISINNTAIHGSPYFYLLKKDDIIKIDCIIKYKNIYMDSSRTYIIAKNNYTSDKLIKCYKIFKSIIESLHSNITVYELATIIEYKLKQNNFGNLDEFSGHCIGKKIHMRPFIYTSRKYLNNKNKNIKLLNKTFTIEPIFVFPKKYLFKISANGWDIVTNQKFTAHIEDTMELKKNYLIIYTQNSIYNFQTKTYTKIK